MFKAGEASGASGSFFFFSHDKLFIIKTMTEVEKVFFIKHFATQYFEYLKQYPSSFLARIYGVYTIKMSGHSEVHLMLMAHTIQIKSQESIERIFDIKGSKVKRHVKPQNKRTQTLKDVNFIQLNEKILLDQSQ